MKFPLLSYSNLLKAFVSAIWLLIIFAHDGQAQDSESSFREAFISDSITFALMGDAIITRALKPYKELQYLKMIDFIRYADVAFTNLEVLFHDYEGYPATHSGGTWMRAELALADELRWVRFDMVSLANNHTMDPQETDAEVIHDLVKGATEKDGLKVYAVGLRLTSEGMDLGSRNFEILEQPKIALFAGSGVSSYEAGETWHLLDQRFDIPVTLLTQSRPNSADLSRYNVIVMPPPLSEKEKQATVQVLL